jgi:hypothetical protein
VTFNHPHNRNMLNALAKEILVRRLGQADAPWLPLRLSDWRNAGAVFQARQAGFAAPLYHASASDAERQRYSRATASLVAEGLSQKDKRDVATLTPAGLRVARGLAWHFEPGNLREALRRLAELADAGDCLAPAPGFAAGGGFVPETLIAGTPWGPDCDAHALWLLSGCLLPALLRGVVESASTHQGHVFYRLTDGAVGESQFAELVDDGLAGSFEDDLADAYLAQRAATRRQILAADAAGEIGAIPIHAGPLRSPRQYDDLRGIEPLFPSDSEHETPAALAG